MQKRRQIYKLLFINKRRNMIKKTCEDYIEEIAELKSKYNLRIDHVLVLQVAAIAKFGKLDYDRLKEAFIKDAKEITNSNNS